MNRQRSESAHSGINACLWKQKPQVSLAWREMRQAPEGPPRWSGGGEEGEAAPPGQIGRMKLFEAGSHRLTGMADGMVHVTQEIGSWPPDFRSV